MGGESLSTTLGSRPKLCVVSTTPLVIHFFIRPHLEALAQGNDVTLVLNLGNDTYAAPLQVPARIISMGIMRTITPWQDVKCIWQLYRLFRREKFDQIWAVVPKAGLLSMVAGWLARVPCRVFIFQGEIWATRRGVMRRILQGVDRLTAWCSTHLLAVSATERQVLEAENIVPPGRIQVLGAGSICGVDLNRFKADEAMRKHIRHQLNIPPQAVVALFLGRLKEEKGVLELVAAFARTRTANPLYLVFVGPDEAGITPRLQALTADHQDRVRMVGYTAQPEHYMAAADFICLPSHREGFGMVIIEAAGLGIPAIGTRVSGVSDALAEDETGLMFPVGDVAQLTTAMERLTDDADLRRKLGLAARARVARDFDQTTVVSRYVEYLRRAVGD